MKKKITTAIIGIAFLSGLSANAQDSLFISELVDPADEYTGRFIELFNAGHEIIDLESSTFFLSRQSNGGTTWGEVRLTGMIMPGSTYVIGGSAFESWYGFAPDLLTGILTGNGDDPYYLFRSGDHLSGTVQDIFGVRDTDGTGELWEYTDSRAVRADSIGIPNPFWISEEWDLQTANIADCNPGYHSYIPSGDSLPASGEFAISISDHSISLGEELNFEFMVNGLLEEDNVISYQFILEYDSTVLLYNGLTLSGTLADGGTIVDNVTPGRVIISYMNTLPIVGTGSILQMDFTALELDTTYISISEAFLNNIAVEDESAEVLVTEIIPPLGSISYDDPENRYGDILLIRAEFNEAMDPDLPVLLELSGVVGPYILEMDRLNDTVYDLEFPVPKTAGEVYVRFIGGADLSGNQLVELPQEGSVFTIMEFRLGDVNDDGSIQAFDAALVLQYSVGLDPLPDDDPLPWEPWRDSTANADGNVGITAYDAGLILQYSAGIIGEFPASAKKKLARADIEVSFRDGVLVLLASGELVGLNLEVKEGAALLGNPTIMPENFMHAFNINRDVFRIGLCAADFHGDMTPILEVPVMKSGRLFLEMIINNVEVREELSVATGINLNPASGIRIYPNPVSERLTIVDLKNPASATIINALGQVVMLAELKNSKEVLDLSGLSEGLYILKLRSGDSVFIKQIVHE